MFMASLPDATPEQHSWECLGTLFLALQDSVIIFDMGGGVSNSCELPGLSHLV